MVAVCALVLASCNKTELPKNPATKGEKVKLSFSVTRPSSAVGTAAVDQNAPLSSLITQLTYVVYLRQTYVEVERVTQLKTDPQFGQVSLSLEKGEYYIVAIGSNSEFGINQYFKENDTPVLLNFSEANMEYLQGGSAMSEKRYKTSDTFFAKLDFTVEEAEQATLELKRIVGKLEIAVEDVKDYWVNIRNEATGYMFKDEVSFGRVDDELYTVKSSDGPISVYIMQTNDPLWLVIGYGGALSQQRNVRVPIEKNKRTIVRGKMLNPVGNNGFSVTIDDKWISEPNIVEL